MFLVEEVQKLDRSGRWNYAFQVLNLETRQNVEDFTLNAARLPQHRNLNRYRDVLPYDHSRVKLDNENGSNDYINANTVEVEEIGRKYVLAQGPLPDTCGHFWQMVWEQNSTAVIMLNRIIEKNAVKCHPYWPMGEDEELEFSNFRITNLSERSASAYVVRELQLEHISSGDTRSIKQFHYMLWPDFGVPSRPETFLNFLYDIRESDIFNPKHGPPVIHCSAGIGRSGTFCLVDSILKKAEKDGKPDNINVKEMLLKLRQYRVGLVQTPEQLRFSYLAIIEGIVKMYPYLFTAVDEDAEESHKRKSEDTEPPPIPPRKRPPPEKPPRMPLNPETTAEEETIKQKKMVQHLQDGIVDESSEEEEEGQEEILNLSESESEEEAETGPEVIELSDSDEEDRLVDVGELSGGAISNPLPPHPPIDETFPIHKPLPPLPADQDEYSDEHEGLNSSENDSKNFESDLNKSSENRTDETRETEAKRERLLPVLTVDEEEGGDILDTINTKKTEAMHDKDIHQNSCEKPKGSFETSHSDVTSNSSDGARNSCENSERTQIGGENTGEIDPGNKAREETELRQRLRRDEKNKETAEMVNNIKRKMKEQELAAARSTLTKKSLIALGISGGLLLAYYWLFA